MSNSDFDLLARVLLGMMALCFLAWTIMFALFCKAVIDFISNKLGKSRDI